MTRRLLPLAVLSLVLPGVARAGDDIRDEIVRALDTRPLRTDLVILLDTSGSMAKHFEAVRKFAGDLGALARPGDTISFIAFAERAGELMPSITVGKGTDLRARLAAIRQPRGSFTDLGAGLDATLDSLLRPGYAPISIVFLITDFCAEPSPGSAYAGELIDRGPCKAVVITDALRKKSRQLFASGDQTVRAFALAIEPSNERGYAAAAEVLGQLVRVDVAKGDVQAALESLRARMQYDRASLAVERMLAHPPLTTSINGKLALQGKSRIGVRVDGDLPLNGTIQLTSLRALDGSVFFELAELQKRELKPGQPFSGWSIAARNLAERAPKWTPGMLERSVELEASYAIELAPAAPIEKLIGRTPAASFRQRVIAKLPLVLPESNDELVVFRAIGERHELSPGGSFELHLALSSTVAWSDLEAHCKIDGEPRPPQLITWDKPAVYTLGIRNDRTPDRWRFAEDHSKGISISGECDLFAISDGARLPLGKRLLSTGVTIYWREGISFAAIAAAVLGLFALAIIYLREVRPRLAPAGLAGRLVIYDGPGDFRRLTVPLRGKVRIELAGVARNDGESARLDGERIVLPGASGTRAEVYAEKSGKKSVMRLSKLEGDAVTFGDEALGPTPVVLRRGRARFSVGEYHCRIE